jgi:arginase
MGRTLDVIGVPSSMGAFAPGQEQAPQALRRAGLIERLREAGIDVEDHGDADVRRWRPDRARPRAQNLSAVVEVVTETARRVRGSLDRGHVAFVLGGDCTIELGTIAGYRRDDEPLGLVYFDLHPDLNVPESVTPGALDWMGMGHALGAEGAEEALAGVGPHTPLLRPDEVVLFGVGKGTDFERGVIEALGLRTVGVEAVAADPEAAASGALAWLEPRSERILVHLDVDVIDFTDLPLSEEPGRNEGLAFERVVLALRGLLASPKLAALTVAELNPDHDPDGSSIDRFLDGLVGALASVPTLAGSTAGAR